jgi:hypothetical protein
MNADRADTRSSHLDLGELIAEVTGQAVDDRAREHLAICEDCQLEASRWNLVADGVRGLAAAAPEAAQPVQPPRARPRVLAGHRRRTFLAASVAAAVVLLGGVGYGASSFIHITFGTAGTGARTALTAVGGCASLKMAEGTLEQVTGGSSLVIRTASGQPVTVTTTASTFVSMSGPLPGDITDGASVMVRGRSSDGTIAAAFVTVGRPFSAVNPQGFVPVQGTVSDASTAGFTLVTAGGARIPVTTSGSTLVIVPHASLGQLQAGATIFALGHARPDGALAARAVAGVVQPLSAGHLSVSFRSCSPSSIAEALAG